MNDITNHAARCGEMRCCLSKRGNYTTVETFWTCIYTATLFWSLKIVKAIMNDSIV